MKKIIMICLMLYLLAAAAGAQVVALKAYDIRTNPIKDSGSLYGNGIVDLLAQHDTVYAATGFGLNITTDTGDNWRSFDREEHGLKGGIAAMGLMDGNIFWISSAFDTTVRSESLLAGGGIAYTRDFGQTWTRIPQPVDSQNVTEYSPTTTNISNITWDIAFVDSTVWIASFGGGLRRSDNMGNSWQVVTTDGLPFSSFDYLNHRAFSLLEENGNLWVGTAAGISRSPDNGATWDRFTHQNQENGISGNFVVAMAYQEYNHTIWAATIEAEDTSEFRAVSKTSNDGGSWDVVLEGIFAHNFAFEGPNVYVAADEGLFISPDEGQTWYNLPAVRDDISGDEILTDIFYSAAVSRENGQPRLWFGSADGLATTADNGNTWKVIRSFVSTQFREDPAVYAYPSPFSPSRQNYIRFQYHVDRSSEVEIKIYDFAMDHVVTLRDEQPYFSEQNADRSTRWDGRNSTGDVVASGVYFFRAKVGDKVTWGKMVVIN